MNPRPKARRRRPLRACLHSRCRSRLETEPTAPAAISDLSRRHASKRHMTASLLIDGRPPSRRLTRGDRSLGIKQRERSQNSQLRIFQRINEELALGTRSTIPHPRRSQVAPKRCSQPKLVTERRLMWTEVRLSIVTGGASETTVRDGRSRRWFGSVVRGRRSAIRAGVAYL